MKVYSDILTREDLRAALPDRVYLWVCEDMPRPRKRSKGWEVSLSGTSPYTSQLGEPHKAATYDEHGEWMARLFDIDPNAAISWWKDSDHFHAGTENVYRLGVR